MKQKVKILLDTDAGDDIDDALAIALGLASEEVEFVGITTVFKNTDERARLIKKLTYGSGIPVYAGYCGGLDFPIDPYEEHGRYPVAGKAGKFHLDQYTPDLDEARYAPENASAADPGEAAIRFIIDCCHRYGKDLIVLAIGPFINIAKVIEADPTALNLARKVVIMGGSYFDDFPEWNMRVDPTASDILFSGKVRNLECIGLDVTRKTKLTPDEADRICGYAGGGCSARAAELVGQWILRRNGATPTLHDPLALYYCICPDIVETEETDVRIIEAGEARGVALNLVGWTEGIRARPSHFAHVKVAKSVDRDRFVSDFLARTFPAESSR